MLTVTELKVGHVIREALRLAAIEDIQAYGITRTALLNMLHEATMLTFNAAFKENKQWYWATQPVSASASGLITLNTIPITEETMQLMETSAAFGREVTLLDEAAFETYKGFLTSHLRNEIIGVRNSTGVGFINTTIQLAKGPGIATAFESMTFTLQFYRFPIKQKFKTGWRETIAQPIDVPEKWIPHTIDALSRILIMVKQSVEGLIKAPAMPLLQQIEGEQQT